MPKLSVCDDCINTDWRDFEECFCKKLLEEEKLKIKKEKKDDTTEEEEEK